MSESKRSVRPISAGTVIALEDENEKLRDQNRSLQDQLNELHRKEPKPGTVRAVETLEKEPEFIPGRHLLDVAIDVIERMQREPATLPWKDQEDEWSERIRAAFPTRSKSFKEYAVAMQMVGNRRSKGELVALVNWLLLEQGKSSKFEMDEVIRAFEKYGLQKLLVSADGTMSPHVGVLRVLQWLSDNEPHLDARKREGE